jgi:hypothetical protein
MKTIVLQFQVLTYDLRNHEEKYVVKETRHTYDESKTAFADAFDVVWEDALNQGCAYRRNVRWFVKDAEQSTLNV